MFSNPRKKPLGFSKVSNNNVEKKYKDEKYRAIKLFDDKKIDDAYISFRDLLKRNNNDPQLYIFIGIIEAMKENYKNAIKNLTKAKELDNKITEIYFNLGKIYNNLDNTELSILNYKKSIEIDSYYYLSYQQIQTILLILKYLLLYQLHLTYFPLTSLPSLDLLVFQADQHYNKV